MSILIVSADERALPHVKTIEQNFDVLQRCTDVSMYVIACLRAENVLNPAQESSVNPIKSQFERNILLYNWLKETEDVSKYETFLRVMEQKDVGQQHVSNLLRGNVESMKIIICFEYHVHLYIFIKSASDFHILKNFLVFLIPWIRMSV